MEEKIILEEYRKQYPIEVIIGMSEEKAFKLMVLFRWGTKRKDGQISDVNVQCPKCDPSFNSTIVFKPKLKQWRCMGCKHQFSVTSWTIFGGTRMKMKVLLNLILTYAGAKSKSFPRSIKKKTKEIKVNQSTISFISKLINSRICNILEIESSSIFAKELRKDTIKKELGIGMRSLVKFKNRESIVLGVNIQNHEEYKEKMSELVKSIAKFIIEGDYKNINKRLIERHPNYNPKTIKKIYLNLMRKQSIEVQAIAKGKANMENSFRLTL